MFEAIKKYGVHFLLLFWLFLHLLFVSADPAINFDFGRGPFTDEGFYLAQLRNYLNGHGWGILQADALLKSPLFAAIFFLPLKIFGISLPKARVFYLLLLTIILAFILREKKWRLPMLFLFPVVLFQDYIFEYSHYVMPEVLCCFVILFGIFFFYKYLLRRNFALLIFSALLFCAAYYLKSQFIYILPLPIALFFFFSVRKLFSYERGKIVLHFSSMLIVIAGSLILYYFFWYKPHKDFYNYLFITENSKRIDEVNHMWETVKYYYEHVLLVPEMKFHTVIFWFSLSAALPVIVFTKKFEIRFFLVASLVWFALEFHKLVILYIPLRYLVPLMFAAGMIGAGALAEYAHIIFNRGNILAVRILFGVFVFTAVLFISEEHFGYIQKIYSQRKYSLQEANEYLHTNIKTEAPVIGNWSPTFTWLVKNENLPVAHWVINDEKIFTTVFPEVIVTEWDENESDGAYVKRGIILKDVSDSVRAFHIGKWDVNVWWINQRQAKEFSNELTQQ